jgi:hypothetical protein
MTLTIPLLALMVIAVYVAYRQLGLKIWHAVACLVLGFLLASTGAAPEINNLITGVIHWAQAQLSGGAGDAR